MPVTISSSSACSTAGTPHGASRRSATTSSTPSLPASPTSRPPHGSAKDERLRDLPTSIRRGPRRTPREAARGEERKQLHERQDRTREQRRKRVARARPGAGA